MYEFVIKFDEAVVLDGATFTLADTDGDTMVLECDVTATCELNLAGDELTVTVTATTGLDGAGRDDGLQYPAELTGVTGIADEAGNLVRAGDSLDKWLAQGNVVANLTTFARDDSIIDAIAGATTGDVLLADGAFEEDVTVEKSLTIRSAEAELTGTFAIIADDVTIDGFTIHTAAMNFLGFGPAGVEISQVANTKILDNTIVATVADDGDAGIQTTKQSTGGLIQGNTLSGMNNNAIAFRGSDDEIIGNLFVFDGSTATGQGSVILSPVAGPIRVVDNTFRDSGVVLDGGATTIPITVEGNDFTHITRTSSFIFDFAVDEAAYYDLDMMLADNTFTPTANVVGRAVRPAP